MIETPYLLYLGHSSDPADIKTSRGLAVFRPDICVGEYRHDDCPLTLDLPRMDFAAAHAAGARQAEEPRVPEVVVECGAPRAEVLPAAGARARGGYRQRQQLAAVVARRPPPGGARGL